MYQFFTFKIDLLVCIVSQLPSDFDEGLVHYIKCSVFYVIVAVGIVQLSCQNCKPKSEH